MRCGPSDARKPAAVVLQERRRSTEPLRVRHVTVGLQTNQLLSYTCTTCTRERMSVRHSTVESLYTDLLCDGFRLYRSSSQCTNRTIACKRYFIYRFQAILVDFGCEIGDRSRETPLYLDTVAPVATQTPGDLL